MGRVRKPRCHDCGSAQCHVVAMPGGGNTYLCGSCEVLRANPKAKRGKVPSGLPVNWPKRKQGKPQDEQLF